MKTRSERLLDVMKIKRDVYSRRGYNVLGRPLEYFGEFADEVIDHCLFVESEGVLGQELSANKTVDILEIVDKRIDEADKKERFLKSLITVVDTSQIKNPFNNGITR